MGARKFNTPKFVDHFYSLITDFYEYGWCVRRVCDIPEMIQWQQMAREHTLLLCQPRLTAPCLPWPITPRRSEPSERCG